MTNEPKDKQAQRRTDFGMDKVRWQRLCMSLRQFKEKKSIPMTDALIKFILILRC